MARKDKKKRSGKQGVSQQQVQAYRARQEATMSREEVEKRRAEEQRRLQQREEELARRYEEDYADSFGIPREQEDPMPDQPMLSPEQIAADYASVRQELSRILVWGGLMFVLLIAAAIYMNM